MRIVRAEASVRRVPLRAPYVLSFTTLETYAARLVEIELDDGRRGIGEVVALPGYGAETDEDVARMHAAFVPAMVGRSTIEARHDAASRAESNPFAVSAVLAAIDVAAGAIEAPAEIVQPLVAAIAIDEPAAMLAAIERWRDQGYATIKVKLGRDPAMDARVLPDLLTDLPGATTLRLDANQAYDERQAISVFRALDHPRSNVVQLLEQPLGVDEAAWEAFARIAGESPVPLMLDESIDTEADIDRAAESGAAWVKLKACKGAGVFELVERATRANRHGLKVVLGNGVATDVSNFFEASIRARHMDLFRGAGEENGFGRLTAPLMANPPWIERGSMHWTPAGADAGYPVALSPT